MSTPTPSTDGVLLEPQPNQPLSIHEPDSVWIVHSGKLDLFLVNGDGKEATGARHHFLRVEAGSAVFGMQPSARGAMFVVATATPATRLLHVSQERMRMLAPRRDPGIAADPLALLEEWISKLGTAAAAAPPPKSFVELEPGEIHEAPDEPQPILPVKGIVWVAHLQGSSRFLDSIEIHEIQRPAYFPVSRNAWLRPAPGSRVFSADSQEWLRLDPEWQALQTFHDAALQRLALNRSGLEEKQRKRLELQAESDATIVAGSLRTLASILQKDTSQPRSDDATLNDPTLLACEAVGRSLGVKIVAPVEMRAGLPVKDPVASIARASSLRHRRVVLKGQWWTDASGPLVAFRDADNHPVALLPGPKKNYQLHDPTASTTIPVNAETALTLNGFASTFYTPLPGVKLSIWNLLAFGLRDTKRELLMIVVMGICGGLLGTVFPVATGIVFDSIIPSAQRSQLLQMSAFLIVAAVAASMFSLTRNFAMLRLEGKMGSSLQAAVWDRLLRLPVPFFRGYTSGDLADRSFGIEYILQALTGAALLSILSGVFSIFSFALLFYYSWHLALIATGLVLVGFLASAISVYVGVMYERKIFQTRGRISGMLLEFINNIARLRVSGAEPRAFAAWAREFSAQKDLAVRAQKVSNALAIFNSAFPVVSLAVVFGFAANIMGQPLLHAFTTGAFLAFLAAFIQFQSATIQLSSAIESALGVVPLYERAKPIFETLPEVTEGNRQPGELSGAIEVNHVNFRYRPEMPLVLRDVSFSVKPGQFVAIVGPSGSGKSSLLRLLLGFEKPEAGAVYYDGQDLAGLDIQAVRQQVGVVMQSARIASGSIFQNIIGSAPLTVDDAWEAARSAGLEQDIREMPMGMHTLISEGGGNLSGGQRQRLLIARAIVKKPRIFLFDEATSALDNRTQANVSHSLEAFRATRIVIAHRLSTIMNADRILVVEKGVIVQSGSYKDLANQEGLFRDLSKRQMI